MKRFLIIALLSAFCFNAFSQGKGQLTFFSQDGQKFWVIINGEKINKEAQYNVKDIPVDFQWGKVSIIFEDNKIPQINKNVQVVDVDNNWCHVKYMIKKDKKGKYVINNLDATFEVITSTTTTSTSNTTTTTTTQPVTNPTSTTVVTTVPQETQTQTQTQTPNQQTTQNTTFTQTTNMTPTGVSTTVTDPVTGETITLGTNINISGVNTTGVSTTTTTTSSSTTTSGTSNTTIQNKPVVGTSTQTVQNKPVVGTSTQTVTTQSNQYVMPGYNGKVGCPWPMKDTDFAEAKKSVVSKSFEDSKLTVAKQITSSNCLLCSQVKEMMQTFSFEDSKLEFAKFAYDYVYDKGNYFKLNDAFNFESTIDELNQYISSKK